MSKRLDEHLGAVGYDDLFASVNPAAEVAMVKIAAGAVIKRGTVITGAAGGNMAVAAAALDAENAVYIVAEDTTADATTAVVYRTGHFVTGKLLTNGTYALTAADKEVLRKSGILLTDGVEY